MRFEPDTPSPLRRLFQRDPFRGLYHALAESVEASVVALDIDADQVLASNHHFSTLSGYTRSELERIGFAELFPGDPGDRALDRLYEARRIGKATLQDVPLRTRSGTIVLIDIEARAMSPAEGPLLLRCQPAVARTRAKRAADRQEELVNTLVALSALILDGETASLAGALEVARPVLAATMLGLYRASPSDPDFLREGPLPPAFPARLPASAIDPLRPATLWSLGHRTENELQRAARAAGLATLRTAPLGSSAACVGVLVAGWRDPAEMPEGAERWMAFIANLCHTVLRWERQRSHVRDLDDRLAQLRMRIRAHYAVSGEGLISLRGDLSIARANETAARMLGYSPLEMRGLPIQDVLVGPKDVRSVLLDARGHGRQGELPRMTIHRRDGTPFPVHLRVLPVEEEESQELLLALTDRSEQQAIQDQSEQLHQRALLGDVTAIFAHEVRNPINNISTGVQFVASRLGPDHPQQEALERIRNECDRLNQLLSDVLFFARPLELKMEALDLAEMLERLLHRWSPRFTQAGITCHTEYDPATPPAQADPRTLEQVIVNLITNALEAMGEGGTLSLSLGPAEKVRDPRVELRIADTGPGIPPKILERIFDPFFTTKKEGTGLGLAISRRILLAHKGTIDVESFPDAGTLFTLRVPAHEAED